MAMREIQLALLLSDLFIWLILFIFIYKSLWGIRGQSYIVKWMLLNLFFGLLTISLMCLNVLVAISPYKESYVNYGIRYFVSLSIVGEAGVYYFCWRKIIQHSSLSSE